MTETFTYDPSDTPTDLTLIRYYTGDTLEAAVIHWDEEISMVLAEEGSVGAACVSLIESIMARLAHEPDATQDWLKVDWRRSAAMWDARLTRIKQKFSLGTSVVSSATHAWRGDSRQTEEPDYELLALALEEDYCL